MSFEIYYQVIIASAVAALHKTVCRLRITYNTRKENNFQLFVWSQQQLSIFILTPCDTQKRILHFQQMPALFHVICGYLPGR